MLARYPFDQLNATDRSGDIGTGDSLGRSIKIVECGRFDDLSDDFRTDTETCIQSSISEQSTSSQERYLPGQPDSSVTK